MSEDGLRSALRAKLLERHGTMLAAAAAAGIESTHLHHILAGRLALKVRHVAQMAAACGLELVLAPASPEG